LAEFSNDARRNGDPQDRSSDECSIAGKYSLAIAEKGGKILDYIYFEVRGPEADPNVLSGDGEGTLTN
jgi:hypothetical protein